VRFRFTETECPLVAQSGHCLSNILSGIRTGFA
jgi:hypothetical protein